MTVAPLIAMKSTKCESMSAWTSKIRPGGGYGLDEVARDATEVAKAWNRSHEAPARSRGRAR